MVQRDYRQPKTPISDDEDGPQRYCQTDKCPYSVSGVEMPGSGGAIVWRRVVDLAYDCSIQQMPTGYACYYGGVAGLVGDMTAAGPERHVHHEHLTLPKGVVRLTY